MSHSSFLRGPEAIPSLRLIAFGVEHAFSLEIDIIDQSIAALRTLQKTLEVQPDFAAIPGSASFSIFAGSGSIDQPEIGFANPRCRPGTGGADHGRSVLRL